MKPMQFNMNKTLIAFFIPKIHHISHLSMCLLKIVMFSTTDTVNVVATTLTQN